MRELGSPQREELLREVPLTQVASITYLTSHKGGYVTLFGHIAFRKT